MRRRNMCNLTGLPGWMRFGCSPGWAGGGAGMGPCAQYLMSGQWPTPQMQQAWQQMQGVSAGSDSARVQMLQQQARILQQRLDAVTQQLEELQQGEQ